MFFRRVSIISSIVLVAALAVLALSCVNISPASVTKTVGETYKATVTLSVPGAAECLGGVYVDSPPPVSGQTVRFTVAGAHTLGPTDVTTNANGIATYSYIGVNVGVDTVTARWMLPAGCSPLDEPTTCTTVGLACDAIAIVGWTTGDPPNINITVTDDLKGQLLSSTCWYVYDANSLFLGTVSDNNTKASACLFYSVLPDLNPAVGQIDVNVDIGTYGDIWYVQQFQASPGFSAGPDFYPCDFDAMSKCPVIDTDVFAGEANIDGLWNFHISGYFDCQLTITQTKNVLPNPISIYGICPGSALVTLTGTVGGGQIAASGFVTTCGSFEIPNPAAPDERLSWNGNYASGTWACGGFATGTFTAQRKPVDRQINITVNDSVTSAPLAGTCWQVYYAIGGKNYPLDIVSDNDLKPSCGAVLFTDTNPAVGAIDIPIPAGTRSAYGDQWDVRQIQAGPGYSKTLNKSACDVSAGKCTLPFVNVYNAALDTDGDGCPDVKEQQTAPGSQTTGGLRDYLNPYDYFNPSHDHQNRVDDILDVVHQFFKDDSILPAGQPPYSVGYDPNTDRTLIGPNAWNLGAPNGLQRVDDILHSVHQFFQDCS